VSVGILGWRGIGRWEMGEREVCARIDLATFCAGKVPKTLVDLKIWKSWGRLREVGWGDGSVGVGAKDEC